MTLTIRNIVSILKANWHGSNDVVLIDNVSIDSRSLQNDPNTLFFAIVGPNHDGHHYINELIAKGVRNFVVTHYDPKWESTANFIVVENTLDALQKFAAFYRSQFDFPVIGITGSNGKTIVKEWLNFLLSPDYNIIRSPKSYNSQVGVPLSIVGINEKHNLGIFEAGISLKNEMENLQKIIQPTIGILTNIGDAHDEGFNDAGEKIKEKLKLFTSVKILILNKNKTILAFVKPKIKTFTWSSDDGKADVFITTKKYGENTLLNITYQGENFSIQIPFQDHASIENAINCLMVMLYFGYQHKVIQSRIAQLYPVEMRLKVKTGINNCTLIDDSYSSDFQSLKIALDFLEHQKQHKKKTLILSDIFQSGLSNEALYSHVSQLVISNKISRVIGIGKTISQFRNKFINCICYPDFDTFSNAFENLEFDNETILIKGARDFHFEKIVSMLEEKTHETILEINLNAISHNLNYYKSKLQASTKIMVMVKAFGYGNGGFEIAKLLEHHKVNYLGVAFADEGIALKNAGISIPIMVMNPESTSFSNIIQHQLEPEIYSIRELKLFLKILETKKIKNFPIHLKLDTGMHRLGFQENNLDELIALLKNNEHVAIKSILSHLATSDDPDQSSFVKEQIDWFEKLSTKIIYELNIKTLRHILNTSGISNYPEAQYDMVRLGIGLYGISNEPDEQKYLENVSTLKSIISQIRVIQKGESVGYGRRFKATKETKIATIPIGYADGIKRSWGNEKGYVFINEKEAKIVGSVCMDMLMVDVTDIECKEGNEVIIFGAKPTLIEIARVTETIPYEIMTGISQRVKRIFYRE